MRIIGGTGQFLSEELPEEEICLLRSYERTGRPLRGEGFISLLENTSGWILRRQKPGRKAKQRAK
ncbi:MAG: hypothetical protein HWN71_05740 [Desulfobacterales bacterium]|nr:hypothetical protein [Desulfobacterales bacterium]